jgi:hypothetical protein
MRINTVRVAVLVTAILTWFAASASSPVARPLATTAQPGSPTLSCNGTTVTFENGIPTDWQVIDNTGGGVVWTNVAGSGEATNYTGGEGDAASVSSDIFNDMHGQTEFDTEMRTNSFVIGGYTGAALHYFANYQHVTDPPIERDLLDVDVSTDGGSQWSTLLRWDEDHGTFRSTPGAEATIDLIDYVGMTGLALRWHYYDPNTGDNDWYAQIDDVELACWLTGLYGDVDCTGDIDSVDALKLLRQGASLPVAQSIPCIPISTAVTDGSATMPFGDLDCSGAVNAVDALKTLRFNAGLLIVQLTPCFSAGTLVDFYY